MAPTEFCVGEAFLSVLFVFWVSFTMKPDKIFECTLSSVSELTYDSVMASFRPSLGLTTLNISLALTFVIEAFLICLTSLAFVFLMTNLGYCFFFSGVNYFAAISISGSVIWIDSRLLESALLSPGIAIRLSFC